MARPTKLTTELQKRLCDAIADGNYYQAACGVAGISYKVFRDWMKRGKRARQGQFREFRNAVLKAEADAEIRIVSQWQAHMPENWQACRDFLARRHPKRWCAKDEMKHAGALGLTIQTVEGVDEDEILGRKPTDETDPPAQSQSTPPLPSEGQGT